MELKSLSAISPIDGRYRNKVAELDEYFSEYALIRYRLLVEIKYFIALCQLPLPQLKDFKNFYRLKRIYQNFDVDEANKVKLIERITNHDVKAVEYYLKKQFELVGFGKWKEFIHFALTSQDINNIAIPYSLKAAIIRIYFPLLMQVAEKLKVLGISWKDIPMLARTHGQPASPTKLGKEINVFVERLLEQRNQLLRTPISAKFGGATGNFNAHHIAYPDINWAKFADTFVNKIFGLKRSQITTQIDHYDYLAAVFDNMKRINNILLDLCRDFWLYISFDYFRLKITDSEVGSSAMPHKVNPIDFENAEGNLGIANALFEHLSAKLPVSRLQRDLSDSTVLRNIGVPIAHSILSFKSILTGLDKLEINKDAVARDLQNNWSIVAEALQTILRREGYPKPFEALKQLTRTGTPLNKETIHRFINSLKIRKKIKKELLKISPENYTGIY
ncbi:MAG: adenylosuccinate lyase [Bacteroidia bacterium]|nr:adenylosuccinate lyase [Bacteroidia bacterium]